MKLIYNILVNFDQPDFSTSWDYINYDIFVEFDSPAALIAV